MSEKIALAPKRTLTRSTTSSNPIEDQYTFQSDDDDHQVKETLLRKRPRGRPAKTPSISSTNSDTDEPTKRSYEKPVTRRASRLGSQTNTTREKIKINSTPPILITPKKRGRKPKQDSTTKNESENRLPSSKDDMTTTTPVAIEKIEEKDLMQQFGSPEQDDFSDDSVDFVWKGSSKLSIEILKRRLPKEDGRDLSALHPDPTAQRKRAMIPRLTNFDALSGKPTTEKSRPRVYAVKSTTMKTRQPSPNEIKRPKWMDAQMSKAEHDEFRNRRTTTSNFTPGLRGRPPGTRRPWNPDDEDEDYDQYEENNTRYYSSRKPIPPNRPRPIYDDETDELNNKTPRMSLTQTYRRNSDGRQPMNNVNRRVPINNGIYKNENYYSQGTTAANNPATTVNAGNTFVAKINDAQLTEVANQSQIFFVNVPQQDQKNHQVLSVLASEQQQVLPVAVVQQAKVETPASNAGTGQNQTLAFTVKLPVDAPKQKKILPKPSPSATNSASNPNASNSASSSQQKPFAWSRPPGRLPLNHEDQSAGKGALTITPINTDLDTMEAAHVLATAADVTMAADARRKAQQQDDDMNMMVDETPSNIANEETVQCEEETQKSQPIGSITANIIDENGLEHTVLLSTEEAQQLLGAQGAILVDTDGQPISLQSTQTFLSPFALDQAQLQALLTQAGIDPNTPLTIEQIDPNQQQSATLCTSPGGTQYTVLTQAAPAQQQFILQPAPQPAPPPPPPPQPAPIAPKEELSSPPKRRAFAVKSTSTATTAPGETFDEINSADRPRRKIFATKSTVTSMDQN